MELQKRIDQLRFLREEVSTLCVVKCRMSHERVVRDAASGLAVMCRIPENSYQRVGLCTDELRAKRLGCSHTSARIKLDEAINVLGMSYGENNSGSMELSSQLALLNNAIHLLDHRKGEAEKKLARILDEAYRAGGAWDIGEKVREVENEVWEMEQLHDEYVEQIGRLRDRVVNEIDKLMVKQMPTNEGGSEAIAKEAGEVGNLKSV